MTEQLFVSFGGPDKGKYHSSVESFIFMPHVGLTRQIWVPVSYPATDTVGHYFSFYVSSFHGSLFCQVTLITPYATTIQHSVEVSIEVTSINVVVHIWSHWLLGPPFLTICWMQHTWPCKTFLAFFIFIPTLNY